MLSKKMQNLSKQNTISTSVSISCKSRGSLIPTKQFCEKQLAMYTFEVDFLQSKSAAMIDAILNEDPSLDINEQKEIQIISPIITYKANDNEISDFTLE